MFLSIDGHFLNTVQFGHGVPFVAHGGWVGSWELWQDPIQLMQDKWRCISYDHRGSGASTFPASTLSPDAMVDDLFRVLDHFEVERCVLAGESMGGFVCVQAVLREPSRFTGLVLIDAALVRSPERQGPLVAGARMNYPATVDAFVDRCVPEVGLDHIKDFGRKILLRADPEAAARMLEMYFDDSTPLALSEVGVPTLLLHGADDAIVPMAVAEMAAAAIPDSELVRFPDTGHVPTMTRPQAVVDAIDDWAIRKGLR